MKEHTKSKPEKRLFTVKDASEYLGHTVWGMRELIWKKEIPTVGRGRKYYIDRQDLDDWVRSNKSAV